MGEYHHHAVVYKLCAGARAWRGSLRGEGAEVLEGGEGCRASRALTRAFTQSGHQGAPKVAPHHRAAGRVGMRWGGARPASSGHWPGRGDMKKAGPRRIHGLTVLRGSDFDTQSPPPPSPFAGDFYVCVLFVPFHRSRDGTRFDPNTMIYTP